ncbi:MAG: uracil-DNA glycosylase [Clostridiaceae bacterium]|nr:uracil-DNA glycosylase [Clostridiaceae bacterium]
MNSLAITRTTPNVYNQYDYATTQNEIRRDNLFIYLKETYRLSPRIIMIGEAPSYKGSRITGVPFTSEYLLMNDENWRNLFGKNVRFKLPYGKDKLTRTPTSTIIWDAITKFGILALFWNAFPFHPYRADNPKSNRSPSKKELSIGLGPLLNLIEIYEIEYAIAIGRKAEKSLNKLNIPACYVRHPAQGGKKAFIQGIRKIVKNMALSILFFSIMVRL